MRCLLTIGTFIVSAIGVPTTVLSHTKDSSDGDVDRTVTVEVTDELASAKHDGEEFTIDTSTHLKIVLVNKSSETHSFTSDRGGETGPIQPGQQGSLVVSWELTGWYGISVTCGEKGHEETFARVHVISAQGERPKAAKLRNLRISSEKSFFRTYVNGYAAVTQEDGGATYWIMPTQQKLESHFGTSNDPKLTATPQSNAPEEIRQLVEDVPYLFGVPVDERVSKNGDLWTQNRVPYGNKGVLVKKGALAIEYFDLVDTDNNEPPVVDTRDGAEAIIRFNDPEGNFYTVHPYIVLQPPFPGYETQGGVMTDTTHHGTTGTGSPLMTEVDTLAAFWALAHVSVNDSDYSSKIVHCMTIETASAMDDYNTHCLVLPITFGPQGVKYEPVETAFELPSGERQSFIHVVFTDATLEAGLQCYVPSWDWY